MVKATQYMKTLGSTHRPHYPREALVFTANPILHDSASGQDRLTANDSAVRHHQTTVLTLLKFDSIRATSGTDPMAAASDCQVSTTTSRMMMSRWTGMRLRQPQG